MIKRKLIVAILSLFTLLAASTPSLACACCVDPGFYQISTMKTSAFDMQMLGEMRFDTPLNIYMNNAGFDSIRGLDDLKRDEVAGKSIDLTLTETFAGRTWRLAVKSSGGREGTLVLPMPATMVNYKVDQQDNMPGTEPSLYKELRFKGTIKSSTGVFRRITRPTSYFLVFQGRGNGCDSASDFTRWRLELDGPRADFAFFGKLTTP